MSSSAGEVLDVTSVSGWCRLAAEALGRTRAEIDALNVFPVPDGDTGTNLHLTMLAAAEALDSPAVPTADAATAWRLVAQGALLGARGNSGVILSQVLRGLAEHLGRPGPGSADEAATVPAGRAGDSPASSGGSGGSGGAAAGRPPAATGESAASVPAGAVLAGALRHAAVLARTAVERPVEGTILSVLDAAAAAAAEHDGPPGDLRAAASAAAAGARRALRRTPRQLEVLARSGVVDAGAAGLCVVLDALAAVITQEFPERYEVPPKVAVPVSGGATGLVVAEPRTGPGFEVMYLLDAADDRMPRVRERLDELGDSLVVVGGDGLWNVHVHVDDAGAAIEAGLAAGVPHRIKVSCLHDAGPAAEQHAPHAGRGVVAVTAADGLAALFEAAGARVVRRESGTVPPIAMLVEAMLAAGDEVAVLPNEPEVLALAEAAAERARDSGVRLAVVPTKAAVQGLAALAVHDPLRRFDEDVIAMTRAAGATRFGHLEVATEEAFTSVGLCQPGDVLGMIEGDVVVIGADQTETAVRVLDLMLSGGGELVTVIPGRPAPAGLAAHLIDHLTVTWPGIEVAEYAGDQPRFPLLLGVE